MISKFRKISIALALPFFFVNAQEILKIRNFDDVEIIGRLMVPDSQFVDKIVIDVPGTGPNTYENIRHIPGYPPFKYYDVIGQELSSRGIAYFTFNTRYTTIDTANPPMYDRVEKEKFFSYSPLVKTQDVEAIVNFLRNDKRFVGSSIYLLGASEGAIISVLVAERGIAPVNSLFLVGTPPENGYESALWQLNGGSSMVSYRAFFDANKDGKIQRDEYFFAPDSVRVKFKKIPFEYLDANHDSVITNEDFKIILRPKRDSIISAIDRHDNEWIWKNYFRIGTEWFGDHSLLGSNTERILRLKLPVYIFHGELDANCPTECMIRLKTRAEKEHKNNISVYILKGHEHSLNFLSWIRDKTPSIGWKSLLDCIQMQ